MRESIDFDAELSIAIVAACELCKAKFLRHTYASVLKAGRDFTALTSPAEKAQGTSKEVLQR